MIDGYVEREEKLPAHLVPPDIPNEYDGWWRAFWELSSERQITGSEQGFGCSRIPNSAIVRWSRDAACDIEEAESFLGVIRAMDRAWMSAVSQQGDKPTKTPEQDNISSQPMTKDLFDALF